MNEEPRSEQAQEEGTWRRIWRFGNAFTITTDHTGRTKGKRNQKLSWSS
jgi:muconolactone delta-isomerase